MKLSKKSLKQIPSTDQFIEFKEFTNEYQELMMNTQESITDNIYTQLTILGDSCDYDINKFNVLDVFAIFLHWRYRCVGGELEFNEKEGVSKIDLEVWFNYIDILLKLKTKDIIEWDQFGKKIRMVVDIPKYTDIRDLYNEAFHINDVDKQYQYIEDKLNSYCYLQEIDMGDGVFRSIESYEEKKSLFNALPKEVFKKVNDHVRKINDIIRRLDFGFEINGNPAKINLTNIPRIIRIIFMTHEESYHLKHRLLAKKRNLSYEYMINLMPATFDAIFESVIKEEEDAGKQGGGGDMDEIIGG